MCDKRPNPLIIEVREEQSVNFCISVEFYSFVYYYFIMFFVLPEPSPIFKVLLQNQKIPPK